MPVMDVNPINSTAIAQKMGSELLSIRRTWDLGEHKGWVGSCFSCVKHGIKAWAGGSGWKMLIVWKTAQGSKLGQVLDGSLRTKVSAYLFHLFGWNKWHNWSSKARDPHGTFRLPWALLRCEWWNFSFTDCVLVDTLQSTREQVWGTSLGSQVAIRYWKPYFTLSDLNAGSMKWMSIVWAISDAPCHYHPSRKQQGLCSFLSIILYRNPPLVWGEVMNL